MPPGMAHGSTWHGTPFPAVLAPCCHKISQPKNRIGKFGRISFVLGILPWICTGVGSRSLSEGLLGLKPTSSAPRSIPTGGDLGQSKCRRQVQGHSYLSSYDIMQGASWCLCSIRATCTYSSGSAAAHRLTEADDEVLHPV